MAPERHDSAPPLPRRVRNRRDDPGRAGRMDDCLRRPARRPSGYLPGRRHLPRASRRLRLRSSSLAHMRSRRLHDSAHGGRMRRGPAVSRSMARAALALLAPWPPSDCPGAFGETDIWAITTGQDRRLAWGNCSREGRTCVLPSRGSPRRLRSSVRRSRRPGGAEFSCARRA